MSCADIARELAVPTGAVEASALQRHLAVCPRCAKRAEVERRFDQVWGATRPVEPTADAWNALWSEVAPAAGTLTIPSARPSQNGTPAVLPMPVGAGVPSRRRGRWAVALTLFAAAQAASILVTALVVSRTSRNDEPATPIGGRATEVAANRDTTTPLPAQAQATTEVPPPAPADALARGYNFEFELEQGQTLIFQLDDRGGGVVVQPRLIEMAEDLVAFGEMSDQMILSDAMQPDMLVLNAMEGMDGLFALSEPAGRGNRLDAAPNPEPEATEHPPGTSLRSRRPTFLEGIVPLLSALVPLGPGVATEAGEAVVENEPAGAPSYAGTPGHRQVTVFGIVAVPDDAQVDPKLDQIADELRKFKPNHGFLLRNVSSRRLATGETMDCELGDGMVAHARLDDALVPESDKLRIRFTLEVDGNETFTTVVTTPPNQLFFCEKPMGEGARLMIGIGAR